MGKVIRLLAKPLIRPAVHKHLNQGECNPIYEKFSQVKTTYGLDLIQPRLKDTSESLITSIFLVPKLSSWPGWHYYVSY
jgi:hypothetical protein